MRRADSRKRAGRSARRLVRDERRRVARKHWWRLTVILVGFAGAGLLIGAVQATPFMHGLTIGIFTTLGAGMAWYLFAVHGLVNREMGAEAELWTAQALRRLGDDWRVFHDVVFADGNVDHIVVGPSRIYAVETKWTSWSGELPDSFVDGWAQRATWSANRVRSVLRSGGVNREVIPLLVVWGLGTGRSAVELRGDTRVVTGARNDEWLERIRSSRGGRTPDHAAAAVIQAYVERRSPRRWLHRLGRWLRPHRVHT